MVFTTAFEAVKAVNSLLRFSSIDQKVMLEIFQDYFASPDGNGTWDDDFDGLNEGSSITIVLL